MLLIVLVAGAAAVLVLVHTRLRETRPDVATLASKRVQQLAAVILVLAKAAEGLVDALQTSSRNFTGSPAYGTPTGSSGGSWRPQPRPLIEAWKDLDDD